MATNTKGQSSAAAGYRLAKLLKHLDNRLCADCGVSLLEWQNYYGSLTHQVWLCNTCFESHVEVLGEEGANGKRIKDEWTNAEVSLMEKAGSNVKRNQIYERYPHEDWKKITQDSPYTERIQYIKAKYKSYYFTIPPLPAAVNGRKQLKNEIGHSNTLPMRTVDYFATLGMGKAKGKLGNARSITDVFFNVELLSCFPNEKFYTDQPSPLPDLLGPMVFPKGLRLSGQEERPYCYTFVLTDTYRVKQFGAVLVVHELLDPRTLQELTSNRRNSVSATDHERPLSQLVDAGEVLYAPKALVVLSHYPFFHLFTRFLEQIYHLSLSSSPLPIERYIANFVLELPLPPQGRIAVLFSLPESQLQISRPPRNQLPMVDFSYRPLFAYLSVDNILAVFSCLCQEMSICICSKNIALLTPVQEALLSLLFPFVWQGCYVPVLPADMAELLHAPVPLLTGMQVDDISETFLDDDPSMRPPGLVIVHLDSDTVHFGKDCHMLPLPKAMLPKLRQKLIEHGCGIHQLPEEMVLLQSAEVLYPNDEHMKPIQKFIAAQGVLSNIHPTRAPAGGAATAGLPPPVRRASNFGASSSVRGMSSDLADDASETSTVTGSVASKRTGFGLRGFYAQAPPKVPKDQKYQHISSHHHPAACTVDASAASQANAAYFGSRRYALDPAYNSQPDLAQTQQLPTGSIDFNAMEVRGAFLRFFVAAFQDYGEYFSDYAARLKEGEKSAKKPTLSKQTLDSTSRPKEATGLDHNGAAGRREFDQKRFLAEQEDAFLKHMINSQMFANFISEIIEEPDQPEIRFFNEHIIAKRNRSKLALTKGSTPFLDDTSEDISQSFTVPGPVTAAVPQGKTYSYTAAFPVPDLKQMQLVVTERGLASTGGAGGYLVREIGLGPEISRLQRGESPQVMRDRVRLQFGPGSSTTAGAKGAAALSNLRRTLTGANANELTYGTVDDFEEDEEAENAFFLAARRRYDGVLRGIVRLQAACRARPVRHEFYVRRERLRAARRLHRILVMLVVRAHFKRDIHRVRILQRLYRSWRGRRTFVKMRSKVRKLQAWYRGAHVRRVQRKKAQALWVQWRRQLQYLWTADSTPLQYRSSFWLGINNQHSLVDQALHHQELRRLYDSLGLTSGTGAIPKKATFADQFRAAQSVPMILKLSALHSTSTNTAADIVAQTNAIVDEGLRGSPSLQQINEQRRTLANERKELYLSLKDDKNNDALFRLFNLQDMKKRKQKLSDLVWVCCNDDYSNNSAKAVVAINTGTLPAASKRTDGNPLTTAMRTQTVSAVTDWGMQLRQRRIAYDCAEVAKAVLVIARKQPTQQRARSLRSRKSAQTAKK